MSPPSPPAAPRAGPPRCPPGAGTRLCTRLLFLRTRPMPSPHCRVTPVQDRLEELQCPCLSPLLGNPREAGTAGMFLPAPASADKQSQRCCWPVGCHLGRWHQSRKDGGPAVCGDRERHSASARGDADAPPLPYTPPNKPMSARAPSPEPAGGMCRIKPLILLPFNPPCAAAAPTSSRSPPYLIKVSAAAPQECRPGYCIPRSTRQPLHPRSCPFDPAALPVSGAGKEKNQQSRSAGSQTASGGAGTPAEGGRRPAMVPRVARAARADSSGVTGAAAAVPERFLVRVPPAEPAGQAALATGPPGQAGLGVARGKTIISVIPGGGTAQRRVGRGTAGPGQSGRPSPSWMRPVGVGHAGKGRCMGGHFWGIWLGRVSELKHLCLHALAPVAVASLGGSQAWKGTFTPRWPKVTPKEGDRHQQPQNSRQVTMKCVGSWQQKRWGIPVSRCQAGWWPCWHPSLCASHRETLVATAWGPAWPQSRSVTRTAAPEDKQNKGSQTPPQPSPPLKGVVVDTAASSSHLCLTPTGEPSHHICQDRASMGWAQDYAGPVWVWTPSAGRVLHCHLAMLDGAMLHVSPKHIPPLARDGCSTRPGFQGQTPAHPKAKHAAGTGKREPSANPCPSPPQWHYPSPAEALHQPRQGPAGCPWLS